jgi:hypothetical protein
VIVRPVNVTLAFDPIVKTAPAAMPSITVEEAPEVPVIVKVSFFGLCQY